MNTFEQELLARRVERNLARMMDRVAQRAARDRADPEHPNYEDRP